jgi:hypothetical protein
VLVVDPKPDTVAGVMEDRIRRGNVYACEVFWDLFASTVCKTTRSYSCFIDLRRHRLEIASLYRRRLERER